MGEWDGGEGREEVHGFFKDFVLSLCYFSKAKVQLLAMCYPFKHITFIFVFYSDPFDKICDPFLSVMYS